MAQIKKTPYIAFALFFFCYCSWGSRPALSSGFPSPKRKKKKRNQKEIGIAFAPYFFFYCI